MGPKVHSDLTRARAGYDVLMLKLHNSGSASDVLHNIRSVVERQLEQLAMEDRDFESITAGGTKRKKIEKNRLPLSKPTVVKDGTPV